MDKGWFLESIAADGSHVTHAIRRLPFRVGREASNDLAVEARGMSRQHAVIELDASGHLAVRDLDSANGTYVNRERVGQRRLAEHDVIHFGNAEYRLGLEGSPDSISPADSERTMIVPKNSTLSENFVRGEREFLALLQHQHGLSAVVQPIVHAQGGGLAAYELLGRCRHPALPASPVHLFQLAATLGREAELSAAFRNYGVPLVAPRLKGAMLFVNTHPDETFTEGFFQSLVQLRSRPDAPRIVVEVHETAVVEVDKMRELAARLKGIGVPFAYDDFGAGQARLNELWEVPAHFVKFDMGLIRGIHTANEAKQRGMRDLVRQVLDLGGVPLAEGVEVEAEAEVCRDMGFRLIQGYLTGRPVEIDTV